MIISPIYNLRNLSKSIDKLENDLQQELDLEND